MNERLDKKGAMQLFCICWLIYFCSYLGRLNYSSVMNELIGTVMTKASGGTPSGGDVYEVYPVIGAAIGGVASLGDKRLGITLKTVGATKLRCIGHDYERGTIKLMEIGHALT